MKQHTTPSSSVDRRQLGLRHGFWGMSRSFAGLGKVKTHQMQHLLRSTIGILAVSLASLGEAAFAQNAPLRPAAQKSNAPALPPGYAPPSAAPPVFTFQKPLLTEDEQKALKKSSIGIANVLRGQSNGLSTDDKRKIADWAKLRVYEMTMPEHFTPPVVKYTTERPKPGEMNVGGAEGGFLPEGGESYGGFAAPPPKKEEKKIPRFESVADVREKLERELRSTGSLAARVDQVKIIRSTVCKEVAARAEEVLEGNYWVRLNAVILLGNLNMLEDDGRRGTTRQAYAPAYKPLIKVLQTPTGGELDQQHESIKIRAALGLRNIALTASLADLQVLDKDEIAQALISELKQPNNHWWYEQSLLEALSAVDLVQGKDAKPIILEALGDVLTDQNQELVVRAYAAKALGRIPLPATVEWPTLAHRIVQLAKEVAETYQKSPGRADLREALWCIYLAFKPETHLEVQRYNGNGRKQKAGFLSNAVPAVMTDAYQQIVPLASHAINQPVQGQAAQIPAEQIASLTKWLQNKTPANNKLAPNISDLNPIGPLKTAAEPGSSGGE